VEPIMRRIRQHHALRDNVSDLKKNGDSPALDEARAKLKRMTKALRKELMDFETRSGGSPAEWRGIPYREILSVYRH